MSELELCSVLLDEDIDVDARKLGKEMARILETTVVEARMAIRKGRGIFLDDVTREQADAVVRLLRGENIAAFAVPIAEQPFFPLPKRVSQIERDPSQLRFRVSGTDETQTRPWEFFGLVSLGAVALPAYQEMFSHIRFHHLPALHRLGDDSARELLRENLILQMEHAPAHAASSLDPSRSPYERIDEQWRGKIRVTADLLASDHSEWLRISMDDFSYQRSTKDVRFGGAWGFTYLMEDLRPHLSGGFTEMTLHLDSGHDIRDRVFLQMEEFQRYTMWNALLRRFRPEKACRNDSSSPSPAPAAPPTDAASSTSSPGPEPSST